MPMRDGATTAEPPDQEQRRLIAEELDRNILVEAAAGTGKTTSLVARMVNLIRRGKCTIDRLAAVTFTRKAAAELRDRFQSELERAARDSSGTAQDRLAEAAAHVERCYLGTIHSFCARLLRERPVEAGVDAAFRELDEQADASLRRRAWDEHVAEMIARSDPALAELDDVGLEIGQLSSAFATYADYPDVSEWPVPNLPPPDLTAAREALLDYGKHMRSLAETLPQEHGNDELMPRFKMLPRLIRQMNWERPAEVLDLLEDFKELDRKKVVQRNWPGGGKQALAELDRWNQFVSLHAKPHIETWRQLRYGPILKVLQKAVDVYERLRRQAGALSFQDLLLTSAALLRDKPAIRAYFRRRFTHLLVDEFQDTDPIQAEVMLLLTAEDPQEADWHRCRPASGSLFVVGDPKQSIYRFRRADVLTYSEVKRAIEASGGLVIPLTANFRATGPLIEWVNGAFTDCFPSIATEFAPARCPLQIGRDDDGAGDLAGVSRLTVPGANNGKALEHESSLIARFVRDALDRRCTVPRSKKERERNISAEAQAGDFLIVTRTRAHLTAYARKLEELGIPHQVTGSDALSETPELYLLYTCLRAVVRPDDPVALVAALRSPLFGISDRTLYVFRQAGGRFSFRATEATGRLSAEEARALRDALERLGRYERWVKTLPPAVTFERVAADLGLPARACAASAGPARAGSLAKVLELVRARQLEIQSPVDLVEYLETLMHRDERHDGLSIHPPDGPTVRLMNLHQAKGLEAAVVFLADSAGVSDHAIDLHIDRSSPAPKGYLAVYKPRNGRKPPRLLAQPAEWSAVERREKEFKDAEDLRLLYVAATRAKTALTIVQREGGKTSSWNFFASYLERCPNCFDPGPQSPPARATISVTEADVAAAKRAIEDRWTAVCRASFEADAMKQISLATQLPVVERAPVADGEHGVEWGSVIHALLEAAMRKPHANLHGLGRSLLREVDAAPDLIERALLTVKSVRGSAIWQRAQASPQRLVEVPIEYVVPTSESTNSLPTIRRGVVDLAFRELLGWVIVDYKTDTVGAQGIQALAEHYGPQVQSYAAAWQTITQEPVAEVGIFFTRTSRYVCV